LAAKFFSVSLAGHLKESLSIVRRNPTSSVIDLARSHFSCGAEVVYIAVEEDGSVRITTDFPNHCLFVAARSLEQGERFVAELYRRSR
jgi:hypothetical protein